jgi:pimeloyl-ACP methyl ester carboxylesterase
MTRSVLVAIAGIALLAFGAIAEFITSRRYTEQHVVANAGNCKMDVTVLERSGGSANAEVGTVVLFHGLAANKVVMRYLARAFAEQGLRVYIPDLPGHGRSAGPFTPDQAEACGLSFVRGLAARGFIRPERTILAGHSMGAAIALRVAAKFRPAGVVAISPAPMQTAHGLTPEVLLFHNLPALQPNTLIMVGRFEPEWMRSNAEELASTSNDATVDFAVIPRGTHVGVLFSPMVARMAQEWAAKVLQLPGTAPLPTRLGFLGGLWGLLGILLIAGPFIREAIGEQSTATAVAPASSSAYGQHHPLRLAAEFTFVSLAVVLLLRYWMPLRPLRLFEGDYLASFLLLAGLIIVLLHAKIAQVHFKAKATLLVSAAFAAVVLHLLLTGWMQLTLTGAWLTTERWTRFPLFFIAAFLFLYGFEVALGPVVLGQARRRFWLGLSLFVVAWMVLILGVTELRSGAILLLLMSPYFAVQFALMEMGAQLVRRASGSATAAAIFGAILWTGFCLVLFPVS